MWTFQDLNSFDGIVNIYNNIKPLVGKRAAHDIRPLQRRSKWYERIIKVDDNTYVLSDGDYSYSFGNPSHSERDKEDARFVTLHGSPIVWMRKPDGDYIQIRSNGNYCASWSRYKFLDYYLPRKLQHGFDSSGKHWITHNGAKHILPKFVMRRQWNGNTKAYDLLQHEDKYLEYKVVGDGFERTTDPHKIEVPVVNRDITKHYNPKIRELWDWAKIVLPIFGDTMKEQLRAAHPAIGVSNGDWHWCIEEIKSEVVRMALDDPEEHPEARMSLVIIGANRAGAITTTRVVEGYRQVGVDARGNAIKYENWVNKGRFEPDEKSYAKFRRFMQKVGAMNTTKLVDTE